MRNILQGSKVFDITGQAATIILPMVLVSKGNDALMWVAFLLGGWQALSFLVHLCAGKQPWTSRGRSVYGYTLLALVVLAVSSLMVRELILLLFVVLAPAGVVMGTSYFAISVRELIALRRPG